MLRLSTPSFCTSSCCRGRRAFAHKRRTRSSVSSPESVVRSMQVMALSSHAACDSFFTVRRVTRVWARRSAALVLTRTASTQSKFSGMPRFGCRSRPAKFAIAVSAGEIAPRNAGRSRLEVLAVGVLSRRVMGFLTANGGVFGNALSYHFDKAGSQATAALAPLLLEIRSPEKGFLRAYLRCRKGGVEIRTRERFLFLQPFAKKHGKAADESISGASSIHSLHLECGDEFHLLCSCHQATALS